MRKGEVKQLIEEVLPLATLALHLRVPGCEVRCRYCARDERYDAVLFLKQRSRKAERFFVEVTSAEHPKDYLIREALDRYGAVFPSDAIERKGRRGRGDRIVSKAFVQDGDAAAHRIAAWVTSAIQAKLSMDYPDPTLLLVRTCPEKRLSPEMWGRATESIRSSLHSRGSFEWIALVSPANEVLWV